MKTKNLIKCLLIILLFVMIGLLIPVMTSYKLTYYDSITPPTTYRINIYSNKVTIIKLKSCSKTNCNGMTKDIDSYGFSESSMKQIKKFIKKKYPKSRIVRATVYDSQLNAEEKVIMRNIINGVE